MSPQIIERFELAELQLDSLSYIVRMLVAAQPKNVRDEIERVTTNEINKNVHDEEIKMLKAALAFLKSEIN